MAGVEEGLLILGQVVSQHQHLVRDEFAVHGLKHLVDSLGATLPSHNYLKREDMENVKNQECKIN